MKTVFITWTDRRAHMPTYGKPIAALWQREAKARSIKQAQAHVAYQNERGGDHRVYVTSPYELFAVAKRAAIAAHTDGVNHD